MEREDLKSLVNGVKSLIEEIQHGQDRTIDRISLAVLQQSLEQGKVRPSEIADKLNVNPSSVTRRVQALENANQVEVIIDPCDKRSNVITITSKGREELLELEESGIEVFSRIVEGWSIEEVKIFTNLTWRFSNTMKEWRTSHPSTKKSNNYLRRNRSKKNN